MSVHTRVMVALSRSGMEAKKPFTVSLQRSGSTANTVSAPPGGCALTRQAGLRTSRNGQGRAASKIDARAVFLAAGGLWASLLAKGSGFSSASLLGLPRGFWTMRAGRMPASIHGRMQDHEPRRPLPRRERLSAACAVRAFSRPPSRSRDRSLFDPKRPFFVPTMHPGERRRAEGSSPLPLLLQGSKKQ